MSLCHGNLHQKYASHKRDLREPSGEMLADAEKLDWKDYLALLIALLRTTFLPLVIMIIILVVIALILRLVPVGQASFSFEQTTARLTSTKD